MIIFLHLFLQFLFFFSVIQCATIVRCRQCRTYINPFVHFVDQRRWRCNVCYRVNERKYFCPNIFLFLFIIDIFIFFSKKNLLFSVPEEFLYDPVSKSYGDPSRRPECKSATIEFIAPTEYMLRPPQVIYIYFFVLHDFSQKCQLFVYIYISFF